MYDGAYSESATLSLRLVANGIVQTSNLTQVSPLLDFKIIGASGIPDRSSIKRALRVETIVDRFVNDKETVVLLIEHYGQADEARHMILPEDLTFTVQDDQSRLIVFETRDTDFAFVVAASKNGSLVPGYDRYLAVPRDSADLVASSEDTTDEPASAKLAWTPADGSRAAYRLQVAYEDITTTGCLGGTDIDNAAVVQVRQKFPKDFEDSYVADTLTENKTVYFQLCSLNARVPPDASDGINVSFALPKRVAATLTNAPTATSGATSIDVTIGGTDVVAYKYALRSGAAAAGCDGATFSNWTPVATHVTASGLTEGNERLCVLGKKSEANIQVVPTDYAWTVDLTPPGAFTIVAPVTPTNDVTPTFTWAASAGAASYRATVASDVACATVVQSLTSSTTSVTATTIADGSYFLCVRALDAVGNGIEATNDGQAFTVDAIPPVFTSMTLVNDVADGYLNAADHLATNDLVTLTASGYTGATYKVVTSATSCDALLTYGVLPKSNSTDFAADGSYKVCAKLVDLAGNITYGASGAIVKDGTAPSFTSLALANDVVDAKINAAERALTAALASTLVGAGYDTAAYKLVTAATTCNVALTYGALPTDNSIDFGADGTYKVCVKLTDLAGNPPAYGSTSTMTLDATVPSAFALSAPTAAATVNRNVVTITWSDPGDASDYDLKIDDTSGCASPVQTYPGIVGLSQATTILADGVYFVCLMARDAFGNTSLASNNNLTFTVATGTWASTTGTSAPASRRGATAVWDTVNSKAIVWGGIDGTGEFNSGGEYDPAGNTWTPTDALDVDLVDVRSSHTAVWTGTQMIVWGGQNATLQQLGSGGVYTPGGPDYWTATNASGPAAREGHSAVWTGTSMLVFGGFDGTGYLNSGSTYDPVGDSWSATDELDGDLPAPRRGHTAVWTGSLMVVFGGTNGAALNSGARFDPAGPDYWLSLSSVGAPSARFGHQAVWTGSKMIVWGGYNGTTYLNDGAVYDPALNTWTPMTAVDAPAARSDHAAVWDSVHGQMLVFGGYNGTGYLNGGAAYDPVGDAWTIPALNSASAPAARASAATVWSGTKMLIFGGYGGSYLSTGGRYLPP